MQLVSAVRHAQSVTRVDYPDHSVCLFEIVSPVGSESPLTTDIPYVLCKKKASILLENDKHMFRV